MEIVNGYVCKNCTDVEYAKKGVDPAHPKDGPDGVRATDRTQDSKAGGAAERGADDKGPGFGPAVQLSGALASVQPSGQTDRTQAQPYRPGSVSSISA